MIPIKWNVSIVALIDADDINSRNFSAQKGERWLDVIPCAPLGLELRVGEDGVDDVGACALKQIKQNKSSTIWINEAKQNESNVANTETELELVNFQP